MDSIKSIKTSRNGIGDLFIRTNVKINIYLLTLMVMIDITPYLERNLHPIITLVLFALWFFSSQGLSRHNVFQATKDIQKWWGIYTIWVILMSLVRHSNISPVHYVSTIYFYFIPYMMMVVMKSYNLKEMKLLWTFILAIIIINILQNYYIGINNPDVFRLRESFDNSENYTTNAGGTPFVAACLFIAPIFWLVRQGSDNSKMKLLMLTGVVLIALYVTVVNNRATAAIVLFVELFVLLLLRFVFKKGKSFVTIGAVIIILIFVSFFFLGDILEAALNTFSENERFLRRLNDIMAVSEGVAIEDLEQGSFAVRYLLWMTSINTFFSSVPHFLFGVGVDVHEGDIASLISYGVGCHSEFFDLAAQFGIIGVIIIYNFLKSFITFVMGMSISEKQKSILIIFWGGFLFYSFVNGTFCAPVFYVLCIFLPTSLALINNKII